MEYNKKIHEVILMLLSISSCFLFGFFLLQSAIFKAMQFLFLFLCLHIPLIIQKIFKLQLTLTMLIVYEIFLILHFIFGEVLNFYVLIKHYDTILHFLTAFFITMFGYSIIHYYLDNNYFFIQLLFAFLFALASEFFWEILEYLIDHIFHTNMQRYINRNNIVLVGHNALSDTIKDMIVGFFGSLFSIMIIHFKLKRKLKIKKCNLQ